jgi:hypothetical protein
MSVGGGGGEGGRGEGGRGEMTVHYHTIIFWKVHGQGNFGVCLYNIYHKAQRCGLDCLCSLGFHLLLLQDIAMKPKVDYT